MTVVEKVQFLTSKPHETNGEILKGPPKSCSVGARSVSVTQVCNFLQNQQATIWEKETKGWKVWNSLSRNHFNNIMDGVFISNITKKNWKWATKGVGMVKPDWERRGRTRRVQWVSGTCLLLSQNSAKINRLDDVVAKPAKLPPTVEYTSSP